jgi:hypothetical protein
MKSTDGNPWPPRRLASPLPNALPGPALWQGFVLYSRTHLSALLPPFSRSGHPEPFLPGPVAVRGVLSTALPAPSSAFAASRVGRSPAVTVRLMAPGSFVPGGSELTGPLEGEQDHEQRKVGRYTRVTDKIIAKIVSQLRRPQLGQSKTTSALYQRSVITREQKLSLGLWYCAKRTVLLVLVASCRRGKPGRFG